MSLPTADINCSLAEYTDMICGECPFADVVLTYTNPFRGRELLQSVSELASSQNAPQLCTTQQKSPCLLESD